MKLLIVADIHYALKQFDWLDSVAQDYDAVCIAGDLLEIASVVPREAQIVVVQSYLERLAEKTRVLVCSGNHDLMEPDAFGELSAPWIRALSDLSVIPDGQSVHVGSTLLSVFPWWDGTRGQEVIASQMFRDHEKPKDHWIWVYHAPPSGSSVSWGGSRHFGDDKLSEWIAEYAPDLVISGHVHQAPFVKDGGWVDRIGDSWVFNMGQQPGPFPSHIALDLNADAAIWFSLEGQELIDLSEPTARPAPVSVMPEWFTDAGRPTG